MGPDRFLGQSLSLIQTSVHRRDIGQRAQSNHVVGSVCGELRVSLGGPGDCLVVLLTRGQLDLQPDDDVIRRKSPGSGLEVRLGLFVLPEIDLGPRQVSQMNGCGQPGRVIMPWSARWIITSAASWKLSISTGWQRTPWSFSFQITGPWE